MNNLVKYGFWAAAIGGLLYIGSKAAGTFQLVKGMSYRIVDFGIPQLARNVLSIPLRLEITNPTQNAQLIDNVTIALSMLQTSQYTEVGGASINNINILPGVTQKEFIAQVDLAKLTKNFLDTVYTVFQSGAIKIKANVLVTVNGITLPPQILTKDIRV